MAVEYPHVKFTGCNFVPTRHPHHENIQLEVYNLNDGLRGRDESYDLIHACSCFKGVSVSNDWPSIILIVSPRQGISTRG